MEDCTTKDVSLVEEKEMGEENEPIELEKGKEIVEDEITPKEGMKFNSLEDVRSFYNTYAQHTGFGTKTRSTLRDSGEVKKFVLSCVREGKLRSRNSYRYSTKLTPRTGCKAQISARLYGDGLWHLTKVILEHNHLVSPSKARFFQSNKELDERVKKQLELNDTVGTPVCKSVLSFATRAGGIENLTFGEKDTRNYIESVRRLRLGEGDAEALRHYFIRMHKENSNFFYMMDIDGEGRLRHVFWADARSRASYKYFGDVISFDTTYLTKRYDMPFAPFVGINHHGQSVLLGCGLLSNESIESYVWLFTAWLTCMLGRPPNGIITDQCKSIQGAVSKVFPQTRHRLCLWHIMRKVPEKLGGLKQRGDIVWKLKKVVYDSLRVEEFEQNWEEMIEDFSLQENVWLKSLYEIRHKWVPVFVRDCFWAGMSTTQCSESMKNAFFDSYVNSKTSLRQFISQYDLALERKYENEATADFDSFYRKHELVSNLPMERQLRTFYTSNMFKKFQEELKNVLNCRCSLLSQDGPILRFEVRERMNIEGMSDQITRKLEVNFNEESEDVHCICHLFQFQGILCSHAICVLHFQDITQLPTHYILQRWRKDFKRLYNLQFPTDKSIMFASLPMDRYNDIYSRCHRIADMGSKSDAKYKFALNAIEKMIEELNVFYEESQDNQLIGSIANEDTERVQLIEPVHVRRKGRPRELRLQSTVEKLANTNKKKTHRNPTNKSSSGQETTSNYQVRESAVNTISNQGSNEKDSHINSAIGTEESINIPETSTSIGSTVGIPPHFGYAPHLVGQMGHPSNPNFQQLMFQEYMRNIRGNYNWVHQPNHNPEAFAQTLQQSRAFGSEFRFSYAEGVPARTTMGTDPFATSTGGPYENDLYGRSGSRGHPTVEEN